MNYWLMKSEPSTFSIQMLKEKKNRQESWDGVRNYQARNFMRDEMKRGDLALFYHSSCKEIGVVGIVEIVKESHPDKTALDENSAYFDPKATKDNPIWFMVDVAFREEFPQIISLAEIKKHEELSEMPLLQRGQRLSIQKVTKREFSFIKKLASLKQ